MDRRKGTERIRAELDGIRTFRQLKERYPALAQAMIEREREKGQYAVNYSVQHSVGFQKPIEGQSWPCPGSDLCSTCSLSREMGGHCGGCDVEYFHRCQKHHCYSSCDTCGGGRHSPVAACCGRSPRREKWDEVFDIDVQPYAPPPILINCHLIPVIIPRIVKYGIPDSFPEIDAWAVPVHKVMNLKGEFRSSDIKDFLGLPKDRKLILSTSAPDNYMEMLWKKGEFLDYQGHGIDYWFPAHFSIYDNDSKYYQFANAKRQQINAFRARSQFVWFRLGEHIPIEFLNPIRNAPSVLISCQQLYSPFNRRILEQEARIADEWFPTSTSFFLIRHKSLPSFQENRVIYEINTRWLMTGVVGRDIDNKPVKSMSIGDILVSNLREVMKILSTRC
ncbi:MAG: hypothetical protein GTO45_17885 [Candidatus Aminicenantes bacterium]|nr:hypothetical protein [Candidatus Aminicenantes bacterium]NIM80650.1 hypothetical protein [Candidatus Aminicenantes bacterium]NIN20031.1 hypothetical protein [Candidatus Aminicenantes bacterium]NIN43819.1 hypothetical protein [Candidatus Aminicenantes bacterium]NIN86629.1 hypothetical protein [Candidatus Aminicenantes bacterium]